MPEPKDRSRINSLDFLLMSLGSILAVYSAGMAVTQPEVAWFFVRIVVVGTIFSYGVRKFFGSSPLLKFDGALYAIFATLCIFRAGDFNSMIPGEPFPRELIAASWLAWMLSLGSFVTWRDGTLLFQAVPSMALFGLVGCYDTFRDVTFAFFVYLMCLATLFARANGREMLRQAAESGYVTRADDRNRGRIEVRQDQALYERMKAGPWRWVAGPEWALASALLVIGLSVLGAPVIQKSVETVAGQIKVTVPNLSTAPGRRGQIDQGSAVSVGNGPNTSLSDRALYLVQIDTSTPYLRTSIFDQVTARGWSSAVGVSDFPIANGRESEFTVRLLGTERAVPTPVGFQTWTSPAPRLNPDGTYRLYERQNLFEMKGIALAPRSVISPNAVRNPDEVGPRLFDTTGIQPRVIELAKEVTEGAQNDRQMAEMIRSAIARRCRYNLKATAVPQDRDPVEYFLFDSKEGYCDLFASAMTQMARAVGLPSRYVQGFLPDAFNIDANGRYTVLERDYHAWCEILFVDSGWAVSDATAGAEEVEGGERRSPQGQEAWWSNANFRRIIDWVGGGLILLGGAALVWMRRSNFGQPARRSAIERVYPRFVRALEIAAGRRKRASETPEEFFLAASVFLNGSTDLATRIHRETTRALYSPESMTEAEANTLLREVKTLTDTLRHRRKT